MRLFVSNPPTFEKNYPQTFLKNTFNNGNGLNTDHFQPKDFSKLAPPDLRNCPKRRKYQDSSYPFLRRSRNIVSSILTIILFLHIIEGCGLLKLLWLDIRRNRFCLHFFLSKLINNKRRHPSKKRDILEFKL